MDEQAVLDSTNETMISENLGSPNVSVTKIILVAHTTLPPTSTATAGTTTCTKSPTHLSRIQPMSHLLPSRRGQLEILAVLVAVPLRSLPLFLLLRFLRALRESNPKVSKARPHQAKPPPHPPQRLAIITRPQPGPWIQWIVSRMIHILFWAWK